VRQRRGNLGIVADKWAILALFVGCSLLLDSYTGADQHWALSPDGALHAGDADIADLVAPAASTEVLNALGLRIRKAADPSAARRPNPLRDSSSLRDEVWRRNGNSGIPSLPSDFRRPAAAQTEPASPQAGDAPTEPRRLPPPARDLPQPHGDRHHVDPAAAPSSNRPSSRSAIASSDGFP
jgi:hypothetical protein